jgi:hypothetical protein
MDCQDSDNEIPIRRECLSPAWTGLIEIRKLPNHDSIDFAKNHMNVFFRVCSQNDEWIELRIGRLYIFAMNLVTLNKSDSMSVRIFIESKGDL